jgi:hypothetical protein
MLTNPNEGRQVVTFIMERPFHGAQDGPFNLFGGLSPKKAYRILHNHRITWQFDPDVIASEPKLFLL